MARSKFVLGTGGGKRAPISARLDEGVGSRRDPAASLGCTGDTPHAVVPPNTAIDHVLARA